MSASGALLGFLFRDRAGSQIFGTSSKKTKKPQTRQDWAEFAKAMKKADRYHVEVY